MIQVRCRECGYLKSLSEDQFPSLEQNLLKCPRCDAILPRDWNSMPDDSIPDEVRHKISALSSKILNSPETSREVVYALESQVRHYGMTDECAKALGLGYAALGENEKAAELLIETARRLPPDYEVMHKLLSVLLTLERFDQAVKVGRALIEMRDLPASDQDVAGLALALIEIGDRNRAEALMESRPDLDGQNPVVKKVKKRLKRGLKDAIQSFLNELTESRRVTVRLETLGQVGQAHTDQRRPLPSSARQGEAHPERRRPSEPRQRGKETANQLHSTPSKESKALLEYWIYSPNSAAPKIEAIRQRLVESRLTDDDRASTIEKFESFTENKELTIDYLFKWGEKELFNYPKELIPRNARKLSVSDYKAITEAKIILRLCLLTSNMEGFHHLVFMVRFVDVVRELVGGVVQDAVSHTLWGTEEWSARMLENPLQNLMESQVQMEALEERGVVWIHSHGMRKFGLRELEMEGVPKDLASPGLKLMLMIGESILEKHKKQVALQFPQVIPKTPFLLIVKPIPADNEGHFPLGSFKVMPYISDYDPYNPQTIRHVLRILQSRSRSGRPGSTKPKASPHPLHPKVRIDAGVPDVKARILMAHQRARAELTLFKQSFHDRKGTPGTIHAVKICFPAVGGQCEWMWVTVAHWIGLDLEGHLENSPILRKDLSRGARVQLREDQIFDWVISSGGRVIKGPYTEHIKAQ